MKDKLACLLMRILYSAAHFVRQHLAEEACITDDYQWYDRWCMKCGTELQVVRPGDVKCWRCE